MKPIITQKPDGSYVIKLDSNTTITTRKNPQDVIDKFEKRNDTFFRGVSKQNLK